jgi:uncharacterized membrane-anchored protein
MNNRLSLWLALGLLQLAVPSWMILRQERTLVSGHEYRLRLAPVDPADPFRGRFMNLAFDIEAEPVALNCPPPGEHSCELYAALATGPDGFATLGSVGTAVPDGDYLVIPSQNWHYDWKQKTQVRIRVPFHAFYLNEDRAAEVEGRARDLVQQARKKGIKADVHALVRVKDGNAVLTALQGPDNQPLR